MFRFNGDEAGGALRLPYLNPQTEDMIMRQPQSEDGDPDSVPLAVAARGEPRCLRAVHGVAYGPRSKQTTGLGPLPVVRSGPLATLLLAMRT